MLKVIKEVSEVSNTQPVTWQIYGHDHFSECPYASFALLGTAALPVLIDLPQTSRGSGCILALCLRICARTSLLALSFLLLSLFSVILMSQQCTLLQHWERYINCTQLFVIAFSKWDGCLCTSHTFNCIPKWDGCLCTSPTPLIALLSGTEVGATPHQLYYPILVISWGKSKAVLH